MATMANVASAPVVQRVWQFLMSHLFLSAIYLLIAGLTAAGFADWPHMGVARPLPSSTAMAIMYVIPGKPRVAAPFVSLHSDEDPQNKYPLIGDTVAPASTASGTTIQDFDHMRLVARDGVVVRGQLGTMLFQALYFRSAAEAPVADTPQQHDASATKYTVSAQFLTFWKKYNALVGNPISGVISRGWPGPVQWFENARLELYPDRHIRLGLIGLEWRVVQLCGRARTARRADLRLVIYHINSHADQIKGCQVTPA